MFVNYEQEPGTHEEIIEFVKKFDPEMDKKLTFFEKADVNGANAREVFSFLKSKLPGTEEGSGDIRWNFGMLLYFYIVLVVRRGSGNPEKERESLISLSIPPYFVVFRWKIPH